MAKKYLWRIADELLQFKLESKGAVLIVGPKWCGKTTTALQAAASSVFMQDPETREQNTMLAQAAPSRFLEGKTPKLIDEWQMVPSLWDAIRFEVDKRDAFGQFILTGLVTPVGHDDEITHTGTGRITRMKMRPMTLYESGDSSGQVSIEHIFNEPNAIKNIEGTTDKGLDELAFLLCRGGWPKALEGRDVVKLQQAKDYFDNLINMDFKKVDGVRRARSSLARFMRSYARNISTEATFTTIAADMAANEAAAMSDDTVASYVNALKDLFVIEEIEAWSPSLRSKTAIRTSNTRHFTDPSIACAALGVAPTSLIDDLRTFGLLFESLCVRDLRTYAERLGGEVFHYRNKKGQEADAVIQLQDGRYGLVEAKLFSQAHIDEGAKNLLDISKDINLKKMRAPSFLMVVTGTPYAYTREDGVIVVPLATLAP